MFGQNKTDDSVQNQDTQSQDQTWQHPGDPIAPAATPVTSPSSDAVADTTTAPSTVPDIMPTAPEPEVVHPSDQENDDKPKHSTDDLVDVSSHDLIEIKQNALSELHPLMEHLEQNPEEKFKTIMMMIQASDDQSQIKAAYEAAKAIKDDKVRAQALLDIVNEINYFTTQHNS